MPSEARQNNHDHYAPLSAVADTSSSRTTGEPQVPSFQTPSTSRGLNPSTNCVGNGHSNSPPRNNSNNGGTLSSGSVSLLQSHDAWKKACANLKKKYCEMWANPEKYGHFADVTFEVGPEKVIFTAHRIILSISCEAFDDFFRNHKYIAPEQALQYPTLNPDSFKCVLEYIYTDTLDQSSQSDPMKLLGILDVAKALNYKELMTKCFAYLRSQISGETSVSFLQAAITKQERRLEEIARSYISSNIEDIFSSKWFESATEEDVCFLLGQDDWELDEFQVFENVKRWCTANHDIKVLTGGQLRTVMGKAFYAIRFPLMNKGNFIDKIVGQYSYLFTSQEITSFLQYFTCPTEPSKHRPLQKFVFRPRQRKEIDALASSPVECSHNSSNELGEDSSTPENPTASTSSVNIDEEFDLDPPPAKKTRKENLASSNSPCPPIEILTINYYIDKLSKSGRLDSITKISETVEYSSTSLPSRRLHLKNLSEFRLCLKGNNISNPRNFMAKLFMISKNIHRLLFFDKNGEIEKSKSHKLGLLLKQRVDVSLKLLLPTTELRKCLSFSINHTEGSVHLNFFALEDVKKIFENLKDFRLKKLAINESAIPDLWSIVTASLEVIVFTQLRADVADFGRFFKSCSSLKTLVCDDLTGAKISLEEHILERNRSLRKLGLGNCKLELAETSKTYENLEELCLDNCIIEEETSIEQILDLFPNLKRFSFLGLKIEIPLLYKILNTRSLEWVHVWGFLEVLYSDDEEEEDVIDFLKKVLDYNPRASFQCSFIIEKAEDFDGTEILSGSSTQSSGVSNWNKWKGRQLSERDNSKWDFKFFSTAEFYSGFKAFEWIVTPASTRKRK